MKSYTHAGATAEWAGERAHARARSLKLQSGCLVGPAWGSIIIIIWELKSRRRTWNVKHTPGSVRACHREDFSLMNMGKQSLLAYCKSWAFLWEYSPLGEVERAPPLQWARRKHWQNVYAYTFRAALVASLLGHNWPSLYFDWQEAVALCSQVSPPDNKSDALRAPVVAPRLYYSVFDLLFSPAIKPVNGWCN
jgi:hypothetical protein